MIEERDELYRSVLQERVNLFREEGYRGFNPEKGEPRSDFAIRVTAGNGQGHQLTAEGETLDEAYENLIEKIDTVMDA